MDELMKIELEHGQVIEVGDKGGGRVWLSASQFNEEMHFGFGREDAKNLAHALLIACGEEKYKLLEPLHPWPKT